MTYDQTTPVTVGELTFDVRTAGPDDGLPVIALHGFPESSLSWSGTAKLLADGGLRVFAPDQRGYSPGARPAEVAAYATDVLAGDVVGLADALGLGSFHLVGHDWGAAVGWYVAAHHGSRLRSLTYIWSDEDMAIGRVPAQQCADFVDADYCFVELAGLSHSLPEQAPQQLTDAILARVSAGR